jgi:DNA-binding NarL/FixJ family response regulator
VRQELLILGAETPALRQVMPILRRLEFQVFRLVRAEGAVELLQGTHFDLIITHYPIDGLPLEELVRAVRTTDSPCRDSGLLVLAPPDSVEEVGGFLCQGVNRIVSVQATGDRLLDAIADLIGVAPRHSLRTVVQFELWVEQGPMRLLTVTENLSATGMLVRGGKEFPVGSCLRFRLILPGQVPPIAGEIEVARHTDRVREHVEGFGGKILSFAENGQQRLRALLEGKAGAASP